MDLKLDIIDFFNRYGHLPLPPYIKREANAIDESQYQTVYANRAGSVAAPTAGLHFSKELLEKIKNIGVETAFVTLHVGAGTFLPIKSDNVLEHKMHSENFHIHSDDAAKINKAKSAILLILLIFKQSNEINRLEVCIFAKRCKRQNQ